MEQEVRELLEGHVADRHAVLSQIEAAWRQQTKRPTASEIDSWLRLGQP